MQYWQQINRVKLDPIRVTPKQAEQVTKAWVQDGAETVMINGKPYRTNVFLEIEETIEPIEEDNLYKLSGGANAGKKEVILNDEGEVVTNWYKKPLSKREYDKRYAGLGYKIIQVEGDRIWVGMRLPEYENDLSSKRQHLTLCTPDEVRNLESTDF